MNLAHTDFSMHTTIREYHQLVDVSCTEVEVEAETTGKVLYYP
jgi:hypothetical protein